MKYYHSIWKAIDNSYKSDIVYIDMAKAFDRIPHSKLMLIIEYFGINDDILLWLKSYLTSRVQLVRVNNTLSNPKPVLSGVPHGSVLGQVLFLMYINDLSSIFGPDINMALFTDDAKLSLSYKNISERYNLQQNLDKFSS